MPVIMVMFGLWLPPGYTKPVGAGGKVTVDDDLAKVMVKKNPKKYKIVTRNKTDGKSIPAQSGESEDLLRTGGDLDFSGRGRELAEDVELLGTDDHP